MSVYTLDPSVIKTSLIFCSDFKVAKAFLMIAMAEKDIDLLPFLWVDNASKTTQETIVLQFMYS